MKKITFLAVGFLLMISGCSYGANTNDSVESNNNTPVVDQATPATPEKQDAVVEKKLDLSNKNLSTVDLSIFNQTDLEELDLSNNNLIGALPSQIGKLKKLRILNASNNQMTGVAAEVGQLSNLEVLDLSNNQLTGLPNELANLKNLKTLNLSGNDYSTQDLETIRKALPDVTYILK